MKDNGLGGKLNRKKREEALAFALVDVIALRTLTELRGGQIHWLPED